ncbi:MAG: hypothetical protein ACRDYD_05840, partial [Acidimicrobiales bacterium]
MMISLVRSFAERMAPPRVLHCDFPLGRPLGRPADPAFQRRVLLRALGLLERPAGPVLEDFGERITDAAEQPLSCPVPPPVVAGRPEAVEETLAYRAAYDRHLARTGRTLVGRVMGADGVAGAVACLVGMADGRPAGDPALPGTLADVAMDVRAYFEEAALELSGHVPAARSADSWFFGSTVTGRLLRSLRASLAERGEA